MPTGQGRTTASDEAVAAAKAVPETGRESASSAGSILTAPMTIAREVADDLSAAARRPETVLYWGGLAALAAVGVIELPVAAAIGVGVAVASGVRRARPTA
jgi:hypothetical protein